ncbi:putative bifunctional diguanylate cyclase/phosphodiesterase [Deinococcus sp.]|uniref:putative bifunctional diguanylate cyclase/phosphodiesterase n=1 Tax=Deinococcus sp. TaxID=47478 RepID=UPI003B5C4F0A
MTLIQSKMPHLSVLLAALIALTVAAQFWTLITFAGERNETLEDFFRVTPALLAALLIGLAARAHVGRLRISLIWLTAALLCFALGPLLNVGLRLTQQGELFPSPADVFSTLSMPLLVISFMKVPHNRLPALERLRLGLDASIIVLVIASYGWFFVLAPAILAHLARGSLGAPLIVAMSYPVYDLLALAIMLIVSAQWQRVNAGSEMLWMMAAMLCWLIADGYFLARCFIEGLPVHHPLEAGWGWGCALFAVVAFRTLRWLDPAFRAARASRTATPRFGRWPSDWLTRYGAYLALPAALLLLLPGLGTAPMRLLGVQLLAGLIVVLVIARQIVLSLELQQANHELQQFSAVLESRVAERTHELETVHAREQRRTRVLEMIALDAPLNEIQRQAAQLDLPSGEKLEQIALERHHLVERLQRQATCDALTGLPNRTRCLHSLVDALEDAEQSGRAVAVLYIDLDRFKDINDTLGHPVGDAVLCQVAERLETCVPPGGLLARLGGDEFMVVLPGLERHSAATTAEAVAHRILSATGPAIQVDEAELFVSVSVGMSMAPDNGSDAVSLQRYADAAMYQAKSQGLGYHAFTPELNARTLRRLDIERLLRHALETDPGTLFHLHYQPIIEIGADQMSTGQIGAGRVVAVEALLRCSDASHQLSPAELIPIAERSGMIVALGRWVLTEACRQNAIWQRAGFGVRVNVNVSTLQFERPDFVEMVRQALESSGLNATCLTLELMESVMVSRFDEIASRIAQLRAMGVQLALDDFGAGYSSLSYLGRLTFDTLKIDRSFTSALGGERDTLPLVASVLSIAQVFGMNAVAEGVETPAQLESLRALGCKTIQGYLFAHPVPASEIEEMLRSGLKAR